MFISLLENATAPCVRVLNVENRVLTGVRYCQFHIEIKVRIIGTHQEKIAGDIHCELLADSLCKFVNEIIESEKLSVTFRHVLPFAFCIDEIDLLNDGDFEPIVG